MSDGKFIIWLLKKLYITNGLIPLTGYVLDSAVSYKDWHLYRSAQEARVSSIYN